MLRTLANGREYFRQPTEHRSPAPIAAALPGLALSLCLIVPVPKAASLLTYPSHCPCTSAAGSALTARKCTIWFCWCCAC